MPNCRAASAWVNPSDSRNRRRSSASAGPGLSNASNATPSASANRAWLLALGARWPFSQPLTVASDTPVRAATSARLKPARSRAARSASALNRWLRRTTGGPTSSPSTSW